MCPRPRTRLLLAAALAAGVLLPAGLAAQAGGRPTTPPAPPPPGARQAAANTPRPPEGPQLPPPLQPPRDEPAWLLFERAMERKDAGELGEALELLQRVRKTGFKRPEVEMAMGDIFDAQAEPDIAEQHYRQAWDLRDALEASEDRFVLVYRLADMLRQVGRYEPMEKAYQEALAEAPASSFPQIRVPMARLFRQYGIDRVMERYRLTDVMRQAARNREPRFADVPTAAAHSGLAWYYARAGRPADAIENALFSTVIVLSQAIEEYKQRVPHYRFESVSRFLALAAREPDIHEFLSGGTLPGDLYTLGVALEALNEPEAAVAAWRLLTGSPLEGRWRDLADRQLVRPFTETLPLVARLVPTAPAVRPPAPAAAAPAPAGH
jgi:tetratricopeptide (TPR) repeat protein